MFVSSQLRHASVEHSIRHMRHTIVKFVNVQQKHNRHADTQTHTHTAPNNICNRIRSMNSCVTCQNEKHKNRSGVINAAAFAIVAPLCIVSLMIGLVFVVCIKCIVSAAFTQTGAPHSLLSHSEIWWMEMKSSCRRTAAARIAPCLSLIYF